MSPLPSKRRLGEIATKGVHLGLRQIEMAPEQRAARRLAAQAVARVPRPAPGAPRVLFLTPRDWAVHVHWEAMIGQALRVRGADVHYLTCGGELEICDRANSWEAPPMPCTTCRQYVDASIDAHGFPRQSIVNGWVSDDPLPWPELDEVSLDDLVDVVDDGLPLGRMVDVPVKWFLLAAQTGDDPLAPLTYRRFLRSSRRVAQGVAAALDQIRPDVVVLLNGLFFFEAITWELCRQRDIDVVTYERGLIKETVLFRRGVPACLLDITTVWDRVRDRPLTPEQEGELDAYLGERTHGRKTIDQFWLDARFVAPERRSNGRLVALFTNLTWDSAVIGQEVAYPSIQAWVAAAIDAFAARPEHELVIRVHPAEVKLPGKQTREPIDVFLRDNFPQLPPNVRVISADDPTSSYPLMEACDVGLVFTSTTGVELALRGKPVIVAGQSHYRGKGFTIDVSTPDEFLSALDSALADPSSAAASIPLARRYAHLFFFGAPIASPGVEEHVLGLARLTVEDLSELEPGKSAAVDRICDGILHGGEFEPVAS